MRRTRANSQWTQAIDQQLLRLAHSGMAFAVITLQLNAVFGTSFTKNAVVGRLHRRGVNVGKFEFWTDAANAALRTLYAEEARLDVIAAKMTQQFVREYSVGQIKAQLKRLGLGGTAKPAAPARRKPKQTQPAPKSDAPAPEAVQPVSIPRPTPVQAPAAAGPVTLLDRTAAQCCWPVNDGGPFLFCGAPKRQPRTERDTAYLSYCDRHFRRLTVKPRRWGQAEAQP